MLNVQEINKENVIKVLSRSRAIDVLESLAKSEKSLTELQFDIRAQLSTVQRAIETLLNAGLIEGRESRRDNRKITLYKPTKLGLRVLEWLNSFDEWVKQR